MPLDTDEIAPPPKKAERPDLQRMSIDELARRIVELKAEIGEIEALIEAKKAHAAAAASVFKI